MAKVPMVGDVLSDKDVEMIHEAIQQRQKNFPGEPYILSMNLILKAIGKRYAPLTCCEGEWEGMKSDIPGLYKGPDGLPRCPNGHTLNVGPGLVLGWILEDA